MDSFQDKKDYKDRLKSLYKFNEILLKNSPVAIAVLNPDASIRYINPAFEKLTGFYSKEIIGIKNPYPWWDKDKISEINIIFEKMLSGKLSKAELSYKSKAGKKLKVIVSCSIFKEKNNDKYYIANIVDVTEERKKEKKLEYASFHDNLTGIYNRAYFNEEIKRLSKSRLYPISIIMGDINSLKLINDVFGHYKGDLLLKKTAKIIKKCCRNEDIISRWGGDEFSIILPKTNEETAEKIILRIKEVCRKENINELPVSISLGSATIKTGKQKIKTIIKDAEDRMYEAKLIESENVTNRIIGEIEGLLIKKNIENKGHINRLMEMAKKTASIINLKKNEISNLEFLCKFHDLGKITIPESIIMKADKLLEDEYKLLKKNPVIGSRIIESSPKIAHVSELILSYHERWDGKGYPRGLKGKEIPFLSRLFSIINSYDTMISKDVLYKKPKTKEEAKQELFSCAGTQFDPELVKEFIKII
ncbi:MAG: diguanylate cyclase [Actinomycetota bacterium]|nr:diguanylate cyclase [Actinomycetota bacterium]